MFLKYRAYLKSKIIINIGFLLLFISVNSIASQQNFEQVVEQNVKSAEQYLAEGNKLEAASLYNQSAYLLRNNNRSAEAIDLYIKVLDINKQLNNTRGQMLTHNSLALLYLETEQYNQSIPHLEEELKYREKENNKLEIISILTNLASARNELGQSNEALEAGNRSIELAKEINNLTLLKRSYGVTYEIYEKIGDSEKSHQYFELYSAIDKKIKEDKMKAVQTHAAQEVSKAYTEKAITEQELTKTSEKLVETEETLQEVEELTREQQMEIELGKALLKAEQMKKRFYAIGAGVLLVFVIILLFMILIIRRANKKINQQRHKLEIQNKEIRASIRYANTIQSAMLPDHEMINAHFDAFYLYMPKDIVSGDFYWFSELNGKTKKTFFAVVDCTGHGVPGAFMSMIGHRILTEIVRVQKVESPAQILELLNENIRLALRQEQTDNNDGMDMAICSFEEIGQDKSRCVFSGAKRPIYIMRKGHNELEMLKGDRNSIGGYQSTKSQSKFTDQELELETGDIVYMFSDGITDQNGIDRKKFGRGKLEDLLIACKDDPMDRQKAIIEKNLFDFMKSADQRDDITLVGLKMR